MTGSRADGDKTTSAAHARLAHELEVHQAELEIQNEELRRVRDEVEALGERYARLYELAPVGYFTLDGKGRIAQANLAGAALLGVPAASLVGRRFADCIDAADRHTCAAFLGRVALSTGKETCELGMRKDDGLVAVRLEARTAGTEKEFLVIAEDISERKRTERMLLEAKTEAERASRAKSAFLANMSHEIRTPLHIIVGLGHLLHRDLVNPVQRQRIDQLCANSSHLLGLINDILDLSRIEAERLALDESDFHLGALVERTLEVVAPAAREQGLALTVDVAPSLRETAVRGDLLRLSQILINLCSNAVKFTARGTVRLAITALGTDAASVTLRFSVEDSGIGIAPADQARLFQAFSQVDASSTRAHGGSGLGLAISQRLVELMGGRIAVNSSPGQGSAFGFTLAMRRADAEPALEAAEAADLRGRRVLFAEDQPLAQEILLEMLEDLGCEADVAADGIEAVECAREHAYDLILMDMQMPRLDGIGATRAIRALPGHRDTPIIALTANAFVEDRRRCLAAGMNGHLGKPVTPDALAAALGQWLADPPAAPNRESRDRSLRFVEMHRKDIERMGELLEAGDHAGLRIIVHDLKGVAGLVGARRFAACAEDLYAALHAGADPARLRRGLAACEEEFAALDEARRDAS